MHDEKYIPVKRLGEITFSRIERIFITCNICQEITTLDFTLEQFPAEGARGMEVTHSEYRYPDGSLNYKIYIPCCPLCGATSFGRKTLKRRKFSAKHTCGSKCKEAISEDCACSCNGANHGINHKRENAQLTLF